MRALRAASAQAPVMSTAYFRFLRIDDFFFARCGVRRTRVDFFFAGFDAFFAGFFDPLSAAAIVSPIKAGLSATWMPAFRNAANFSAAVPLPPEMIAPACPMRRPGGAV